MVGNTYWIWVSQSFRPAQGQTRTTPDAGEFGSFTILTGPSAGWLGDYHTRAPVILEPDEWGDWLDVSRDPAEIIAAVRPERFAVA